MEKEYKLVTRDYMVRGKDGFTSLMLEEEGGPARSIVSEESGLLISTIMRQYFMSLKVLGRWKNWGHHLHRHWEGIHEDLHEVHPVRDPVSPEVARRQSASWTNGSPQVNSPPLKKQRTREHSSSHDKLTRSDSIHVEMSDSEDEHSESPTIPHGQDLDDRVLQIKRKFMRKWWRLTGLPGHPNLADEHGEESGVHWTRGKESLDIITVLFEIEANYPKTRNRAGGRRPY